jgi:prepilin-type N-terminal cleavage/methylation domain-containing protein
MGLNQTTSPRLGRYGTIRRRRGNTGFTLVELLVVVSIIALLIAILLPSLRRARDQARQAKCMANLHSIGLGVRAYSEDFNQIAPHYETVGRHGFRIAPLKRSDPTAPEESWGLQVALAAGCGPTVLPNGLAYPVPVDRPVYMPYDSDAWICPANTGPKSMEGQWKEWGNSYSYFNNSNSEYSIDKWANSRAWSKVPIVWDNYKTLPGESGFIGPFSGPGYRVPATMRVPPHRVPGRQRDASAYWIAFYVDGHVQMNVFNKD